MRVRANARRQNVASMHRHRDETRCRRSMSRDLLRREGEVRQIARRDLVLINIEIKGYHEHHRYHIIAAALSFFIRARRPRLLYVFECVL